MENVYVLLTYLVALITLAGCAMMKVGDILEQKRRQKYYQMIKDDAAFWQMKVEQTGMNLMDWMIDQGTDKMLDMVKDMNNEMQKPETQVGSEGEPMEKVREDLFEGLNDEELIF